MGHCAIQLRCTFLRQPAFLLGLIGIHWHSLTVAFYIFASLFAASTGVCWILAVIVPFLSISYWLIFRSQPFNSMLGSISGWKQVLVISIMCIEMRNIGQLLVSIPENTSKRTKNQTHTRALWTLVQANTHNMGIQHTQKWMHKKTTDNWHEIKKNVITNIADVCTPEIYVYEPSQCARARANIRAGKMPRVRNMKHKVVLNHTRTHTRPGERKTQDEGNKKISFVFVFSL